MSEEGLGEGLYYFENVAPYVRLALQVRQVIYRGRTRYQSVEILVLEGFGLSLVLDGFVQSTEADEHIYHESLVHPALLSTPSPRSALILGGGEGATLREVLKHNTIERCVMVDIDGELLELAKKYLAPMHRGSFWDKRALVVVQDGAEYVRRTTELFDAVILDLTDPHGPEISKRLYTEPFYEQLKRVLRPDGMLVSQLGCSFFYPELYSEIVGSLAKVFPRIYEYQVWTPSFGYSTNFVLATSQGQLIEEGRVDEELRRRGVRTLFYNSRAHRALFSGALVARAIRA